jgi:hypothetical protein
MHLKKLSEVQSYFSGDFNRWLNRYNTKMNLIKYFILVQLFISSSFAFEPKIDAGLSFSGSFIKSANMEADGQIALTGYVDFLPVDWISGGVIFTWDRKYVDGIASADTRLFGSGIKFGIRYPEPKYFQPYAEIGYLNFGRRRTYKLEDNISVASEQVLQRFFLSIGSRLPIFKVFGITISYQFKLYETISDFSDQFQNMMGIGIGIDALIPLNANKANATEKVNNKKD